MKREKNNLYIPTHSIAELYSNLTRKKPSYFNLQPRKASQIIHEITDEDFSSIILDQDDYLTVINELAERDFKGPVIYDGLISRAAKKVNADKLVTINEKNFKKLSYIHQAEVIVP